MNKVSRILITTAVAAGLLLAGAPAEASEPLPPRPAGADLGGGHVTPQALCDGRAYYTTKVTSGPTFKQAKQSGAAVTGGPGVTLSITRSKSFTVSGSVTGTAGFDAGAIIAKASASVGVTLGASYSSTITHGGSWKVPRTWKVGELAVGSLTYSGKWYQKRELPTCRIYTSKSGSFKAPRKSFHFNTRRVL